MKRSLDADRRRLLLRCAEGAVVMGAAGLWLPACDAPRVDELPPDGDAGITPDAALAQVDVDGLRAEIWMEDRAIQAYATLGPALSADLRSVAALFKEHHEVHREDGASKLRAMGVSPPAPPTDLPEDLPDLDSGDVAILEYALLLERQAVRAYMGLIAQLTRDSHRYGAANILGSELSHLLALEAALGDGTSPPLALITDVLEAPEDEG